MLAQPSLDRGERLLTEAERREFDEQGYFVVRGALAPNLVDRLLAAHDRIYEEERVAGRLGPDGAMHAFAFVLRDHVYLDLLDLPSTFPLIWGLLGWNIYMYHCHLDHHPRSVPGCASWWGWHQDGGRQNFEIESQPMQPRLSVKVGYFLSDVSTPGRGNFAVVPGSHRRGSVARKQRSDGGWETPKGAVEVCAHPGDAVLFDRRVYHSRTENHSEVARRALFLAYTYRWVRERDDYPIDRASSWFQQLSPVRRQLLGAGSDARSFWGLSDDDYPLYTWLSARGLISGARNMRSPAGISTR
jgi:ectoine hydroxylase